MIEQAIYIQYPLTYDLYQDISLDKINRLPLPQRGMMYDGWENNNNHFTTEYHRRYVIPLLCKLLHISYVKSDFVLQERKSGTFDISIYKPTKEYSYEIYGYTRGEHFDNLNFYDITTNTSILEDITDYHRLYRYSHESSRLINKTIDSNRKLFISGDSQFIPDISFLSCFFKEIWYFDNRDEMKLADKWKDEVFTDVIIEINNQCLSAYTETNFQ